jgi:hypothetical protein
MRSSAAPVGGGIEAQLPPPAEPLSLPENGGADHSPDEWERALRAWLGTRPGQDQRA